LKTMRITGEMKPQPLLSEFKMQQACCPDLLMTLHATTLLHFLDGGMTVLALTG